MAIAADGDRAAFTQLFGHFAPRVKSYLLRQGASAQAAEELAQETLLTVWRKAALFDPARAGASTWIFTIARRMRRSRSAARTTASASACGAASDGSSAAERDLRIRRAMNALPQEQAEIIHLSFFSDEPHSAIAERLGLPLGTVKSRLRLAVGRLRALLEDLK